MSHERWCQHKEQPHDDAAKRVRDAYLLHRLALGFDAMGKWIACDLQTGESDNTLYDTYKDAVSHQGNNENRRAYIKLAAPTMNECEAFVMLKTARAAYDNGLRLADPSHKKGGKQLIRRIDINDMLAMSNGMPTNLDFSKYSN